MGLLEIKDLEVSYGVIRAIKGISFSVDEGEIVTLIGANGSGKSTIMKAILNLTPKDRGTVTFMGEDITDVPCHTLVGKGLTEVPEGRHIFRELTVYENLQVGGYLRKNSDTQEDLKRIFELFPRLYERKNQVAATLSGGEQQMLAMGRAMMEKPRLIMLDEPSMGLSPLLVDQVFEIIKAWHQQGVTVLLVEQNAGKSLAISDRGYVIENGKIVLSGTGQELLQKEEVRKAYLGGN